MGELEPLSAAHALGDLEPLSAAELLALWERGSIRGAAARACLLAWPAAPDTSWPDLVQASIGERNRALLHAWQAALGTELACRVDCPACGSPLELQLAFADLLAVPVSAGVGVDGSGGVGGGGGGRGGGGGGAGAGELMLEVDEYSLRYRRLTTEDLMAVERSASVESARLKLIERCLERAWHRPDADAWRCSDGADAWRCSDDTAVSADAMPAYAEESAESLPDHAEVAAESLPDHAEMSARSLPDHVEVSAESLPDHVVAALGDALASADPLLDVRLRTACAECGHSWSPSVDLAELVWTELERAARRTLDDVHVLAERYGWREADILALSPARRRAYLERAGAE